MCTSCLLYFCFHSSFTWRKRTLLTFKTMKELYITNRLLWYFLEISLTDKIDSFFAYVIMIVILELFKLDSQQLKYLRIFFSFCLSTLWISNIFVVLTMEWIPNTNRVWSICIFMTRCCFLISFCFSCFWILLCIRSFRAEILNCIDLSLSRSLPLNQLLHFLLP